MCQIAVYLDDEKIIDSVLLVEPVPEGIRLVEMFEPPQVVSAAIARVDLMQNKIFLNTVAEDQKHHEGN
jgi:predicted RNA-binding protein